MSPDIAYSVNMTMLALTVWREARGENYLAKLAVAYSILTRVAEPRWWGTDLLSVIGKPLQYSSMTHAGDPNLIQYPKSADPFWEDCVKAAVVALSKTVPNPAPEADSYFDTSIPPPVWAKEQDFIAAVGAFRFFKTV